MLFLDDMRDIAQKDAKRCIIQLTPGMKSKSGICVEHNFSCNLNPGLYFLNAGVTAGEQDAEVFLHRVLDICMFRVLPLTENTATAIVHFDCVAQVDFSAVCPPQ